MLNIFFTIFIFHRTNIIGQEISANLQKAYQDKDSLMVTLTLKNETNKPVYLVCGVDVLIYGDFY